MKNVFTILKRDVLRLIKTPAALIVVIALFVFPSLYTWYNVWGFWNPYGNTENMRVCVVNEDTDANSELTGNINIGDILVDNLKENDQLKWVFEDKQTAMDNLNTGVNFAVIVIPKDFSANLLTIVTGDFIQPQLEYYVNEKTSPVSPKITDAGSSELEEKINSTFVSKVSEVVTEVFEEKITCFNSDTSGIQLQIVNEINEVISEIDSVKGEINGINNQLQNIQNKKEKINAACVKAKESIKDASSKAKETIQALGEINNSLDTIENESNVTTSNIIAKLEPLVDICKKIGLSTKLEDAINSIRKANLFLNSSLLPQMRNAISSLEEGILDLSSTIEQQVVLIEQLEIMTEQIDSLIDTSQTALSQTASLMDTLEEEVKGISADISSLKIATVLSSFLDEDTLDANKVIRFMASPTTVKTEKLYYLNAYGSGMAPLFMNLTFWIGAFMIIVVMKEEVDKQGIKKFKTWQGYLARYLLFAIISFMQAIVCCTGVLILGVEAVSIIALYFAAIVACLAYQSIIYALSVLFQHIGKGLCIIMVFIQIPAASGLYPLELTAPFYKVISPMFPFTYGINAMREAICGFYEAKYVLCIVVLLALMIAFLAMGVVLRPLLSNVNRTFAQQVAESDIYNNEQVEAPEQKFQITQAMNLLFNQEKYREEITERYTRYMKLYPILVRVFIVSAIIIPIILVVIFSVAPGTKAILLGLWVASVAVLFIGLAIIENLRMSLEHQLEISKNDDSNIKEIIGRKYDFIDIFSNNKNVAGGNSDE